jgi:alcohol dehydrogenase class IV
MTTIWGMTEGAVKRTGKSEDVRARLVVYDPSLTLGLPLDVSIASAWNAMAHAVEAMWAPELRAETERAASGCIAGFAGALPQLLAQPGDLALRGVALEASYLGGVALAEATMGLHHKLCHVLGGRGMPHAQTHAALLPHVVRFNRDAAPEAMARIAGALAGSSASDAKGAGDAGDARDARDARDSGDATARIFALASATRAPSSLASLGLHRDAIDDVVRDVLAARPPNPRPLDALSLRALLLDALEEPHAPA